MKYDVDKILPLIVGEYEIAGQSDGKYFTNVKPVTEADPESLVFIDHTRKDKQQLAEQTKANIIICDSSIKSSPDMIKSKCLILTDNPKFVFAGIVNHLFTTRMPYGIHPTAYIHPEAEVHENTYIGPFTYIGKSSVGEDTIIYGHCFIYDGVKIGKSVNINAGCVLGGDGFGFEKNGNGEYVNFPQLGDVIIEDNVDIGANCCIDRGALASTIIRRGTKINNLVHIAHNVRIGRRCLLNARVNISGSVAIGDEAVIGTGAAVRDGVKIGKKAYVGMGAAVVKDVPEGITVVGVPAKPMV